MSIYKKLFEAKKEIGKISKDSTNPFFKSKYFDINSLLEHVEPILQKHDLLLLQPIINNHQQTVIVDVETGEKEISQIELSDIKDPQKKGSEITYFRRYTAQSLLGLQAEDDDANSASKHVNKQIQTPKRLTADQVKSIPTSDKLYTLETVLNTYVLKDNEKEMIVKRIKELKK